MSYRSSLLTVVSVGALGLSAIATAPASMAATQPTAAATAAHTRTAAAPILYYGSRGVAVRAWQQDIDQVWGKIPSVPQIAVDGVFGARTEAATKDFQRFAHLTADGVVGPKTRAAMMTALHGGQGTAPAPAPILYYGSRGVAVRAWQQDIDQVWGKIPSVPQIAVDGVFGARTEAATKDFQRFAHLTADGVVGPKTRAAMMTALHGSRG
ncbi:peptidoglycan-binding domain-containing protein [Rudaeicoccus suwonensis]|uniref:Peptidoglycan hydrolase-like protein with peptidoglycan-binding domain n=1 Tax=Rudaeicoccus suwonensis TaxID=657409 RepID=A0A561E3A3_9MICO|nr:peptidoglycan-binding protein [Rudaeicoccus suwonensis]TWE10095.1 peptidoglycan hydrolase-like protein with peptidoglycan-binding domain [Rudaeicoccus suwonensis]